MTDEYMKVRITASQTVRYAQTVDMSVADYEAYQKLVAENARDDKFEAIAERYLNFADIHHSDRLEEVEVHK